MGIAMLAFTGCGAGKVAQPSIKTKQGQDFKIMKSSEGDYTVWANVLVDGMGDYKQLRKGYSVKTPEAGARKRMVYTAQLEAAARSTKAMGYSHFVLTNSDLNNLAGFPINNLDDFLRYVTLEDRKPNFDTINKGNDGRALVISSYETFVRFKPVGAEVVNSGLYSVWSVSDFVN